MALVKLTAFCIQNYRSIINSGWRSLGTDNITVLIGQNESGKTSVLEALQSFYDNNLNEDVLRSDNTFPIVSCKFKIEGNLTVTGIIDNSGLAPEIAELIKEENEFSLTREWNSEKKSVLYISSEKVLEHFQKLDVKEKQTIDKTESELNILLKESDNLFNKLEAAESDKNEAQSLLNGLRKTLEEKEKIYRKSHKPDLKEQAEKDFQLAQSNYIQQEKVLAEKVRIFEELNNNLRKFSEKMAIGNSHRQVQSRHIDILSKIKESKRSISDIEQIYELKTNNREKRKIAASLNYARIELGQLQNLQKQSEFDLRKTLLIASKVLLDENSYSQAENDVVHDLSVRDSYLSKFKIGEELFKHIPIFEFFEDFSGLLPNKIDLEDILNNNNYIEGYKAAVNFLKIAGLDSSFFREKNQRILKQRIEALNSDVTVNFQDYWSQNVGKDNKIRLHFELEHYDYTIPEKSGKPYLEFWIKDKQERLYPKQRSRGVRWFLSFYLELKAAAINSNTNRVLLIDEPGLSLHARAQEDVLKVFEDLKQSMQIIYCTHSPHLVKTEKLYRVLAVQRKGDEDDKSESVIYEPSMLSLASSDTLTPIYSMMGVRLADQQFIQSKKNILIHDTITYYYLHWLNKIIPGSTEITFIPAAGKDSMKLLFNILSAWQIEFGIILFAEENNFDIDDGSKVTIGNKNINKIHIFKEFNYVEDIFSTIDFKKFVMQQRVGITEKNSEYISNNCLSREILATNFVNCINEGKLSYANLDETSKQNVNDLFTNIKKLL